MIATLGRFVREQVVELVAAAVAVTFLLTGRVTWRSAAQAIDTDLLLVLFALLITVEVLRASGWLEAIVAAVIRRISHSRAFAAAMIAMSGVLATLLTNDVALFVVIPFTVIASRMSDFDVEDAVILQVIAANLLGCLTPLGNPQNLFVYHQSGWSAAQFVATMAPFVAWSAVGLLIGIFIFARSKTMTIAPIALPALRNGIAVAGTLCFGLVILNILHVAPAWIAAAVAAIVGVVTLRRRIAEVDLSIVPLFFFAFIVVEGLRSFDVMALMQTSVYTMSIALSQVISNVPATILLTPAAHGEWRELLYGVNAGGCGTIIASLANLLGWRIYVRESNRDPKFFRRLTIINFVFLAWAAVGGWVLLRVIEN